jgi:hypothetical protein
MKHFLRLERGLPRDSPHQVCSRERVPAQEASCGAVAQHKLRALLTHRHVAAGGDAGVAWAQHADPAREEKGSEVFIHTHSVDELNWCKV